MATNVYIDGFNLYYGCLRRTAFKWLDLEALSRRLVGDDDIGTIRYFTARVSARPDKPTAAADQDVYLRALATLPLVSVTFGHFLSSKVRMPLAVPPATGPKTVEVIRTEEKGSDVNLATYLLADGFRERYDKAVVVSNDSDLAEPIRFVQAELELPVGLVNPQPPSKRSRNLLALSPLFFKQVKGKALAASQLPHVVEDSDGRSIRKPVGW